MRDEQTLRSQMVEVGRLLYERGLVGATEGNITCCLDDNLLLATPRGACKGFLRESDLVIVDRDGHSQSGAHPSSELRLHLRAYRVRPETEAVVHAHPLTATAFALAHRIVPGGLLPEAVVVLGEVRLAPFGMPGTEELPDVTEQCLRDSKTVLLSNHGAVTLGSGLWDAFWRMETLERVARIALTAELLGGAHPLPLEAVAALSHLVS